MKDKTQQQLSLIQEMIQQTRTRISEGSIFYLIWGWLVVAAAAINYYLLSYTEFEHHWIAWPILMTLGGLISGIIGYRKDKQSGVKTYVDRALNYLWAGFTFSLILILLMMIEFGAQTVYPIVIILYGLGTFVSGGILKFKALIWGGVFSWAIGSVAVYADFQNQLLLLIAAILVSYILPGYLLSKSKQHV